MNAKTSVRTARWIFIGVGLVALVIWVLYACLTLIGKWTLHPINLAVITAPALASGITLVVWRLARQRLDSLDDMGEATAQLRAQLTELKLELTAMRRAVIADVREEVASLRIDDTVPLPRAVGTAYIGGGYSTGVASGFRLGLAARATAEGDGDGDAQILPMSRR